MKKIEELEKMLEKAKADAARAIEAENAAEQKLIQSKKNYKLAGQDRLRIEGNWPEAIMRTVRIKEILKELQP
jgi:hypothetical protein